MEKIASIFLFIILLGMSTYAQQTIIKGSVLYAVSTQPILGVTITIEETNQSVQSDALGEFTFSSNVPLGEHILKISKDGFITKRYPIVVNEGRTVNIRDMTLDIDLSDQADLFTITLSDDELNDDTSGADNISGLLQSSLDVFQRTAAFEFSSSFFRLRGLDSDHGSVLINGIEMNKAYNGRPQWSNWGGLNDVMRNQEFTTGLTPSSFNFGGILGTLNINTRASNYRKGFRVTYSSSNRSYTNRIMASYSSGLVKGGWAYTLMAGRRFGNEGYQDATLYEANSFFGSLEKKIDNKHRVNFTAIYAQNRRGKSSPNTQEIYNFKGIEYNEYWGWQDGKKRNSRIKEVNEPIIMFNHYWTINSKTSLNTNIAYQFGALGNSRLDYGRGANPSGSYYQKLPSYAVRNFPNDSGVAYGLQEEFVANGQIDWARLYEANAGQDHAVYALYEDRVDDKQLTLNTILNAELNDNILLNASINYKTLESENFAEILDLFGASGFLNVDSFDSFQFDENNPNFISAEGDRSRYNYDLNVDILSAYAQAQFKYNKQDFFLSGSLTNTNYQRKGLYENGANIGNSFGKGDKLSFTGIGLKGGATYKITGRHLVDVTAGYITRAPSLRNTYTNSRSNQDYIGVRNGEPIKGVDEITEERITSFDASYIFRSPILKAKLTGYYVKIEDANEISFFFADGVVGFTETSEFVSEVLQGVNKKHIGGELGIEAQVTPTIKLKGAASIGQYTYDNNPTLYMSSDNQIADPFTSNLKNYKVASGPQRAFSVGFEYRDPDYWWFGATTNFFANTYVDISPLTRTENFYKDPFDAQVFNDYDENLARELLKQEEFDDYMIVNLIGGKSWKIGGYFIGFFASVNNLLDKEYKTGGFEQGRSSNFRSLRDDNALDTRVFGPKYWYGRGTNYFVNVYLRF